MAENKTVATAASVEGFIGGVEHAGRRADALVLDALFRRVTGWAPRMWGPSIIGYGRSDYRYDSGHGGSACATGFSPRKAHMVLYVLGCDGVSAPALERLGKHKAGKSCLYINRLADVDMAVLEQLIREGVADLARRWPVSPT